MTLSLLTLPPVTTEHLHLRALGASDAGAFRQMTNESAITNAIDFLPTSFTLLDAQILINGHGDGKDCFWGVWLRENALLIGTVGTHLRRGDELEVGYWFISSVRGRALAQKPPMLSSVRSAPLFLTDELLRCHPQNEASWRLLAKIGFRADGTDGARSGRKRLALVTKA